MTRPKRQHTALRYRSKGDYERDLIAGKQSRALSPGDAGYDKAPLAVSILWLPETYLLPTVGEICADCAQGLGARWPKGHGATQWSGVCPVCKETRSLCSTRDWLWEDEGELAFWD